MLQSDQIIDWLAANIGPEPGTTYSGILAQVGVGTIQTITGVAGASMSFDAPLLFDTDLSLELWAVRDGHGSVHWIHQFRTSAGQNLAWSLNNAFSHQITPNSGTGPYTYAVQSGSLPTGLSLNAGTGEISGTPTVAVAGQFFMIRITDSLAATEDQPHSMDVVADPDWNSVVLLCGFDGAIVNESATPVTLTANGDAQVDATWAEYGAGSLLLDGSGDWVSAADSDDWTPAGDYTWEATVRPATAPGTEGDFLGQWDASGNHRSWHWRRWIDGHLQFVYSTNGSNQAGILSDGAVGQNVAVRVRVTYEAGTQTLRMFVDGVLQEETATVSGFFNTPEQLLIGARHSGSGKMAYWNGWIDEVRLTKGVARSTESYTPDPFPFPRG